MSQADEGRQTSLQRVEREAARLGLDIDVRHLARSTRTAADAAAACDCDVARIVKSLVFEDTASGGLVLLLVSGAHDADLGTVARATGRELTRCGVRRVREATGFAIGGVAPFGHLCALPVYMDETLLEHPLVWCAAGRPDSVFSIDPTRLAEAIGTRAIAVAPAR